MYRTLCILLLLVVNTTSANILDFLEPLKTDATAALGVLAKEDELSTIPLAVVFVTNELRVPEAEELSRITAGRSTPVSVFVSPVGVLENVTEGRILVFQGGRRISYHGLRDAVVIVKYISQIEGLGLRTIANKLDKIAFDRTQGTKLVGYFAVNSTDLAAFEEAAKLFGAQIAFFVVTDATVAMHVKLNATGQVYLFRELDKIPILCPQNPATLADIQRLIVRHRESFVKVTPMNARSPSFNEKPSILLITDSSPSSYHLLKMVTRLRHNSSESSTRMLWIDANDFPLMDVASRPIHGLSKLPGLGFLDPSTGSYEWMDLEILDSAPADRVQEDLNLLLIKTFISSRLSASSKPADLASGPEKTEL